MNTENNGYLSANTTYAQPSKSIINNKANKLSFYGAFTYTFDERYVFNASIRSDASNRFGQDKNKRFQPTWSAGFKWNVASEPFVAASWWLNNLDIYTSYGYQGNAVSSVGPELITTEKYLDHYGAYGLEIK